MKDKKYYMDVEINLKKYFFVLWDKKKIILAIGIIMGIIGFIYARSLPYKYKSSATFFMPEKSKNTQRQSTNILQNTRAIPYLQSFLGFSMNSNDDVSKFLGPLMESKRLKKEVAKRSSPYIKENKLIDFSEDKTEEEKENRIIGYLELEKNIKMINEGVIIELIYSHIKKELTKKIILIYVDVIEKLASELELTAHKDIIKILDMPEQPEAPYSPNKMNIAFIFFIAGILIGTTLIIVLEIRNNC
jgi:uncharacterized protein involved in exopolysaccharide biosynthesis